MMSAIVGLTMAYAIGHISGCHLNPAVTVGLAAGGRFPTGQIAPHVVAQVIGAIPAAALLYAIASGAAGFDVSKGFASNGYEAHSPGKYSLVALAERRAGRYGGGEKASMMVTIPQR
jgi:aquaporin Z